MAKAPKKYSREYFAALGRKGGKIGGKKKSKAKTRAARANWKKRMLLINKLVPTSGEKA